MLIRSHVDLLRSRGARVAKMVGVRANIRSGSSVRQPSRVTNHRPFRSNEDVLPRPLSSLFRPTSSPVALAIVAAVLAAAPHETTPFTVTFRFGHEVIGPEPALDIVLPGVAPSGVTQAGIADRSKPEAKPRLAEIWVTLTRSPATQRLSELARATSEGRPLVGSCELNIAAGARPAARIYTVSGCFAKTIDASDSNQRVTLGYSSITVSQ